MRKGLRILAVLVFAAALAAAWMIRTFERISKMDHDWNEMTASAVVQDIPK